MAGFVGRESGLYFVLILSRRADSPGMMSQFCAVSDAS